MVVQLSFVNSKNNQDMCYMPYGVSTIAVQVNNHEDMTNTVLIRPTNRSQAPDYYGYESGKNGKQQNVKTDLKIIWGAGMTQGYKVRVKSRSTSTSLFFQVIHDPIDDRTDVSSSCYSVGIEAVDASNSRVLDLKFLELRPPSMYSAGTVRMKEVDLTLNSKAIELCGKLIPNYVSRWFEPSGYEPNYVTYDEPKYVIRYKPSGRFVSDRISIHVANKEKAIAEIAGDLNRSKIHVELFNFIDKRYLALRIWCFWIHDQFTTGTGLINRFLSEDEMEGRTAKVGKIKHVITEVPDIERFDLIISTENNRVVYVGTDLHWQETWWSTLGETVHLRFAKDETLALFMMKIPDLIKNRVIAKDADSDPVKDLKRDLEKGTVPYSSQTIFENKSINQRESTKVGKGTHRKHVPYIKNLFHRFPEYYSPVVSHL